MIKAVDRNGQSVSIDTVQRSAQCYCPICGQALLQKRGEIREHHFSHIGPRGRNEKGYVMEHVTNAHQRFSTFFTNSNQVLSIAEFVRCAREDPGKLLYMGKNVEAPTAPTNADGFTVFELWNPEYAWMVIKRTTDGKEMIIRGTGGKMFREDHNPHSRIVGKYTHRNYGGDYWYSDDFYVVWDAEKPVWILKASRKQ